jgi:hypothetical protein
MLNGLNNDIGGEYFKKRTRTKQDVQFINVDLEVWSKNDLEILIDAFGDNALEMGHFRFDNGDVLASFEIAIGLLDDWQNPEVDEIISKFCGLIENLPKKAKQAWNESYKKVFDIGFDSGNTNKSFNTEIKVETLKRVQEIGAGIVITIYPVLQYTIQRKDSEKVS